MKHKHLRDINIMMNLCLNVNSNEPSVKRLPSQSGKSNAYCALDNLKGILVTY